MERKMRGENRIIIRVHFNIEKKMQKPSLLYYVLTYDELA